jgi:hypothetical protein
MKSGNGRYSPKKFAVAVGRALRRAGRAARKTARAHGTPVYVWREGKVVAEKPLILQARRMDWMTANTK